MFRKSLYDLSGVAFSITDSNVNGYAIVVFHDVVPTDPSINPVEQPIDLFLNEPAHTTFIHVGITARPVAPLASSLFNRPAGG
jgi:hypothetical protein